MVSLGFYLLFKISKTVIFMGLEMIPTKIIWGQTIMILTYSINSREGGDIGLFIILVPKVYNNVFQFVGLTT